MQLMFDLLDTITFHLRVYIIIAKLKSNLLTQQYLYNYVLIIVYNSPMIKV